MNVMVTKKKKKFIPKTSHDSMRLSEEDMAYAKMTGMLKPEDSIIRPKLKPLKKKRV